MGTAHAGTAYEVHCENAKCGFTTSIGIGGGRMFEEASGYCAKCSAMVSVTWKRDDKPKSLLARFWDSITGQTREIFRCKTCQGPFVKLEQIEDFKHCPKCGKASLKAKQTILYD